MSEPKHFVDRRKETSLSVEDRVRFDALKETVTANKGVLDNVQATQIDVVKKLEKLSGNGEIAFVKASITRVEAEQTSQREAINKMSNKLAFWGGGIAALSAVSLLLAMLRFIFNR